MNDKINSVTKENRFISGLCRKNAANYFLTENFAKKKQEKKRKRVFSAVFSRFTMNIEADYLPCRYVISTL